MEKKEQGTQERKEYPENMRGERPTLKGLAAEVGMENRIRMNPREDLTRARSCVYRRQRRTFQSVHLKACGEILKSAKKHYFLIPKYCDYRARVCLLCE